MLDAEGEDSRSKISVLITTYPEAFLTPGGGEVELVGLGEHLQRFNISADIYGSSSRPLHRYDAVLHFSVHGEGLPIVRRAKEADKPLILWPNVWWTQAPLEHEIQLVNEFFRHADRIAFKSRAEYENILRYISFDIRKAVFVPWGVNPAYGEPLKKNVFGSLYRVSDYILWVGVIEERKNQINAVRALRDFGKSVVFIGDHRNSDYFASCSSEASDNIMFLPFMPPASPILVSAVRECAVFLETSLEPAGLSALEAAVAGRPLVLSDDAWTREEFGDEATLVDPLSPASIRRGVELALKPKSFANLSAKIKSKHLLPNSLSSLADALSDLLSNQSNGPR